MTSSPAPGLVDRLRPLIIEYAPDPTDVVTAATLLEDLGYHSLAVVQLSIAVEAEFALSPITPDDAIGIRTVGELIELVDRLCSS